MLDKPMKRICPSLIFVARSNTPRQVGGLMKGSKPSTTSISANAPSSRSQTLTAGPKAYFFAGFGAGAGAATEPPRSAWKNSLPGSTTITSDLVRKLARYASRLR
jgi:hypothetical protein